MTLKSEIASLKAEALNMEVKMKVTICKSRKSEAKALKITLDAAKVIKVQQG